LRCPRHQFNGEYDNWPANRIQGDLMRLMVLDGPNGLPEHWTALLQSSGFDLDRFQFAADADEALRHMAIQYAMLIVNRDLPDGDGIDWLRSRRRAGLQTPVVMISPVYNTEDRIRALEAGADDAVSDNLDARELLARLRALLRRHPLLQPDILRAGNVQIDLTCRQLSIMDRPVTIPRRELGILEMLLRTFTRALTREFLEQSIYGAKSEVSPNSVEVRISRLRRLLNKYAADVEIETMRGVGYRLRLKNAPDVRSTALSASFGHDDNLDSLNYGR
jgi:DNA-binding response OmpR family regulator